MVIRSVVKERLLEAHERLEDKVHEVVGRYTEDMTITSGYIEAMERLKDELLDLLSELDE